ncbi:restriction endonuclease subunit S [Lutibacter sp.]|uniref:restriction endonuclease subunit S n=1 Tax=Lutibacter sp. TaxID=1925666 RepID=UPI001A1F46FC|nr:restriction endonuclease subunit S [Lutibacter sp.]MBI9041966.1 restriction endonuclease subunit S [Lutibacter sp.]
MRDKLLSYCDVVRGVSYSPYDLRDSYKSNMFYLLRSNNIKEGKLVFKDVQIVDDNCVSSAQKLEKNDIAVCMSNGSKRLVGKSAQFKGSTNNFCVGAFCAGFRPGINSEPNYIYQLFQSREYQKYIDVTLAGSAINNLKGGDILNFEFDFPPLPQQQKIANILSTCDEVIEKTEAAIAKYQALKQGLMHDLFTRGIDLKTGKLRPTYHDAPEFYKQSELGMVPKDWEIDELTNLTKLVTDGSHFSPVPQEKGMPIGNVKDMIDGTFNYANCTKILPEVFELLVRQNCSPIFGDVLLSKDGTIGKVIHFIDDKRIVLLSSIAIIRVNELIDSEYLSWTLQSEFFDKALYSLLSGSALKRITLKDIQKIKIPFSKSLKEQKVISMRIESIQEKIQTEQQTLAKYQQLKAGLMQDLLTGKVEVKV